MKLQSCPPTVAATGGVATVGAGWDAAEIIWLKFMARGGLVFAYAAFRNFCNYHVLTSDGYAGDAPEDCDLADVGEGVGDGALQQFLGAKLEGRVGGEIVIEGF